MNMDKLKDWLPLLLVVLAGAGSWYLMQYRMDVAETALTDLEKTVMHNSELVAKHDSSIKLIDSKVETLNSVTIDLVKSQQSIQIETNSILSDIRVSLGIQGEQIKAINSQLNNNQRSQYVTTNQRG